MNIELSDGFVSIDGVDYGKAGTSLIPAKKEVKASELVLNDTYSATPKTIKDLSPQQIESCLALNKMLIARNIVVRSSINFNEKVSQFLRTYEGKGKTPKGYKTGINKYITYCNNKGIKPEMCNLDSARGFKYYMESEGLSNKTINLYITSIRLLFQFVIDNDEYFQSVRNPFEQKKLHKNSRVLKKQKDLLSYDEELKLLNWFKNNCDNLLYETLYYQINFGVRIDTFEKIKSVSNGRVDFVSKSRECLSTLKIRGSEKVFKVLMEQWKQIGTYNLNVRMNRYYIKALKELNINKHITTHCFKHTLAKEVDGLGYSGTEISKILQHNDLSSKDSYLNSGFNKEKNSFNGLNEVKKAKKKVKKN